MATTCTYKFTQTLSLYSVEDNTHKVIDEVSKVWPLISGVALTISASIGLWWHDRKETKKRIGTLETLATNMVTQKELQACRDDVREDHVENLEKIYNEIKENTSENARQHQDIMSQIVRLHK